MCLNPKLIKNYLVGCGKCIECKIKKSTEWAYRVMLESSLYEDNCMITLTYNEDNLPKGETLLLQDLQKFIKRLRKQLSPLKIRYFACGEYGSLNGRPHYHIIIFGWKPTDLYFFCYDNKKTPLYRSPLIEKEWTLGFSSVGEVTFDSAKYCAIYLQKPPKDGRKRPFVVMSRRPGLGLGKFNKKWLESDKIYFNGKYISIPKYFLEKADQLGYDTSELRSERVKRGNDSLNDFLLHKSLFVSKLEDRRKKFENIFENGLDNNFMV